MEKIKYNIIKNKVDKSFSNSFDQELEKVKSQDINYLIKKDLLIDGVDYYFYPIVIDIELEANGKIFMVGLYFPFSNEYFSFIFDEEDSEEYIMWVKCELIKIFDFFKENSFSDYKDQKNNTVYPILVGHNIIKYDFILLFHFLYINKWVNKAYNELKNISDVIIYNEIPTKFKIYKEAMFLVYREIKTFFSLDTLICINAGEARSLFRFKTDIYFNSNNEKILPLEFDLKNKVLKSDENAINNLCKYNFNDLYFNYRLIFFSSPKGHLKNRCLLYKNLTPKTIKFAESINKTDSVINCLYIVEKANINRKADYVKSQQLNLNIEDCVFLNNYHYMKTYLNFFKKKNIYKFKSEIKGVIDLKNIQVNMGVGGLHSVTKKISTRDNSQFYGSQLIFSSSNEEFFTLILDFQSFYVNIVLQLLEKVNTFSNEKDLLKELNEIRLKLKKNKDPNDKIFKISTLAYTGSLNDYRSKVFYPKLYHSMTLNGQLLCLELLNFLDDYIEKIIEVNTDGVVIYIKKTNYDDVMLLCDNFENKYNFKIDTREIIKCGLFFTANKKITFNNNSELNIKGFKSGLSFGFLPQTLAYWISNYTELLENFNNSDKYKQLLYMSLWKSFNCQIRKDKLYNNVKNYLNSETVQKTKLIVFFSKNPSYFGGIPSQSKVILHPYPIKDLNFKSGEEGIILKKNIIKNLDISSYWSYFMNKISPYFLYNITNDFENISPIVLDNYYNYLNKTGKVNLPLFYLNNKKIIFYFNLFSNLGFVCFMKDRDKKSFPKKKMSQTGLIETLNSDRGNFHKYMQYNYRYGMENGVAIAINLKESWDNDICCIDFDGVEWFFKNTHFNEENNLKQKSFLKFILSIKEKGFLVFSSMTNTPFDRFKIFFKIKNKPEYLKYNSFKTIHNNSDLKFDFNIEDLSSIIGSNMSGQKLINKNDFNELQHVQFEDYNNYFLDKSLTLLNNNNEIKKEKYFDLLICIFEERSNEQRTLYNGLFENYKKVNLFEYQKYPIDKNVFLEVFMSIVKKKNFNKLNINDVDSVINFYNFSYKQDNYVIEGNNLKNLKLKDVNKKSYNLKKPNVTKIDYPILPKSDFIENCGGLKINNNVINYESIQKVILLLTELFYIFNEKYNTTFKYSEFVDGCFIFHSNCIFKNDNNNNKQVTAYINTSLQCYINCYHESCKIENRYKLIENSINNNLYCELLCESNSPFIKNEELLANYIKLNY